MGRGRRGRLGVSSLGRGRSRLVDFECGCLCDMSEEDKGNNAGVNAWLLRV